MVDINEPRVKPKDAVKEKDNHDIACIYHFGPAISMNVLS